MDKIDPDQIGQDVSVIESWLKPKWSGLGSPISVKKWLRNGCSLKSYSGQDWGMNGH